MYENPTHVDFLFQTEEVHFVTAGIFCMKFHHFIVTTTSGKPTENLLDRHTVPGNEIQMIATCFLPEWLLAWRRTESGVNHPERGANLTKHARPDSQARKPAKQEKSWKKEGHKER